MRNVLAELCLES
jgi:putative acyl-CoA dehydrogenase